LLGPQAFDINLRYHKKCPSGVLPDKSAQASVLLTLRYFQLPACIPPALRFDMVNKLRAELVPAIPYGLITYVHASFMQKLFHIT
jgi:hypothetical protein